MSAACREFCEVPIDKVTGNTYKTFIDKCNTALTKPGVQVEFKKTQGFWFNKVSPRIREFLGYVVGFFAVLVTLFPLAGYPGKLLIESKTYKDTFFGQPKAEDIKELEDLKNAMETLTNIYKEINMDAVHIHTSTPLST